MLTNYSYVEGAIYQIKYSNTKNDGLVDEINSLASAHILTSIWMTPSRSVSPTVVPMY